MKRGIALLLALVICFSLCACGGSDSEETKKKIQAAEGADRVIANLFNGQNAFDPFYTVKGHYDTDADVYTVSISYNTDGISDWLEKEYPATKNAEGLRQSYLDTMYETLSGETLGALMGILKGAVSTSFSDLDTEIVYEFTDQEGTTQTLS